MRDRNTDIGLDGVVLADVRTGEPVDLGRQAGVLLLTLIRHRF